MDNQHRKISGYRELSQEEIDLMNEIKAFGPQLEQICIKIREITGADFDEQAMNWAHRGEYSLKEGLMFLTRAVAKPTFF